MAGAGPASHILVHVWLMLQHIDVVEESRRRIDALSQLQAERHAKHTVQIEELRS